MAYTKTNWVNGTTPLNDKNINKIENALENLDTNMNKKANSADVYTKTEIDTKLNKKQEKLTAGTGIEITETNIINNLNANYSTDEIRIGTWTDGKPIYRRVINTTGDKGQSQTIAIISNIDNIVNMFGWVKNGNIQRSCFTVFYGDTSWASQLYRNSQDINLECGSSFANFKNNATITLICEYTKTTD